ncbi:hypothetical protein ACE7GA_26680 (plasmid) [Roseomonas sp. CCTCC AB2023176]|uniref:hypothetical protein n=1 Tax=Roseomonas sp. CCTCC AB2023176 TaxID=3342640 RepID=UPI0035D58616
MATDPLLDHIEKTFADAYRKEIDQEENVWRSLPFFAATLALQLAGIAQVRDWIEGVGGPMLLAATGLLIAAGLATFAAIAFLALSVWPADFQYVGREPLFRDYAEDVRASAEAEAEEGEMEEKVAERALRTVKAALIEQYATAVDNNRVINQRRARWRTRAGLATLASVLMVLVLVALVVVTNIGGYARQANPGLGSANRPTAGGDARPAPPQQRDPAADGRGSQGLVGGSGDGASGVGVGRGRP